MRGALNMRKIMSVVVTALLAVSTVFGQTARTVMMGSPGQPDAYRLQSRDHIVRSNMLAVAAGDLSGTAWASTVKGLQGKAIPAPGAGDTGKGYVWNGSAWVLQTASATANWGAILGTLSNQTDLWAQLTNRYTKAETLGLFPGASVAYASVAGYATNAGYAATAGTSDYATVAGSATNLLGPQQNNVSWNGYNITDLGQLWVTNIWLSGIILDTNSVAIFSGRTFYDAASTIVFDFSGTTGEMELGAQDGSRSLGLYGSSVDVYTNMTVTGYIQQRTNDWHYWGVENVDDSWRMGPSSTNFVVQVRVGGTWTNAVIFTRP